MTDILMVEDSRFFGSIIKNRIESTLNFNVQWAKTYSHAVELIDDKKSDFFVGLLDLNLPDAPLGEIVDFAVSKNIPSIVFTGEFCDDLRDRIWEKKIIDYVLKESNGNVDYIISLIKRIYKNRSIKVLVVDDSMTSRKHVCDLLKVHQYNIFNAVNGVEAVSILDENPDIKMVITDYNMPKMDGFQLTRKIRTDHKKEEFVIIGMSAYGNNILSAKFIKNGANDFIIKPFSSEEFYCRITQNIEMNEYIAAVKDSSNRDYLTELYNRRYFFDVGKKLHAISKREERETTVAMIDIDHFKKINDVHGHDIGDAVLKRIGLILKERFRESDIVSRFGGEEFCIFALDMAHENVFRIFDELRGVIESTEMSIGEHTINVSVSIGVCSTLLNSLEQMIKQADIMLYKAKNEGRNRVLIS
ncbi:MAG: diguanylate cyclase [Thermodesulfobacteriota bacterium]|nr:diguanylate cyclase [Thermodesulfobacteriota bacterium]